MNARSEPPLPDFLKELAKELPLTLTKEQACSVLKVSRITLERAINARKLRVVKNGSSRGARVIIPRGELLRYLAERAQ